MLDVEVSVWRDFLRPAHAAERAYLSQVLEDLDTRKFARHRFRQVKAFDDFNLKLGILEAAPGAILRGLRRWWEEGWPSVSGAVTIETLDKLKFANVRLIGSVGRPEERSRRDRDACQGRAGHERRGSVLERADDHGIRLDTGR